VKSEPRLSGYRSGDDPGCFHRRFEACPLHRSPAFDGWVHSPTSWRPLQSSLQPVSCLAEVHDRPKSSASTRQAPSGVSSSLFATSVRGVHLPRGAPSSTLRSVLGVPPALDGLLRHVPCGLVPSRSHVQGLPSRGDHTAEPYRVVPGRCPPVVGRPRLQPKLRRQDTPSPSGLCSPRWV